MTGEEYTARHGVINRIRVLFGNYLCPDCYQWKCTQRCGRRHQDLIHEISESYGEGKGDTAKARDLLKQLIEKTSENEPEVVRIQTFMAFMDGED